MEFNLDFLLVCHVSDTGVTIDKMITDDTVLRRGSTVSLEAGGAIVDGLWQPLGAQVVNAILDTNGETYEVDAGQVIDALLAMCAENHPQEVTNVTSPSSPDGV